MKYSNRLISTLLIGGGLLNAIAPVLAAGVAAGQGIDNTATATYEDPTGAVSNTTSNTVKVTVAEVAGITITSTAVKNTGTVPVTTGPATGLTTAPVAGDNLVFEFDVTNIGNDTTNFVLPNQAQVGNSPATVQKVQYLVGGVWTDVSTLPNGLITTATTGGDIIPGAVVKVRVLATVNAGTTTTSTINITYGSTGQTNLQNDPFAPTGGDVYTVDKADGATGEAAGVPSNGVREAAATGTTVVNPSKQAFVKVSKVAGAVDNNGTTNTVTDDKVTYNLKLEVAGTAPTGTNLVAEDLAGTDISIDGTVLPRILVSDAIPAGSKLVSIDPAPTGWTIVYTTSAIGATTANNVAWTTTAPGSLDAVTRVGYIKSGTIAKGTEVTTAITGFAFTLKLNLPATGGSVLNIAQAFGTTSNNGVPDPTKPAVDESGDAQFNNLNADGTPGPNATNGVATGADGVDTANTNTGTGTGGEANIVTVTPPAPVAGTVLIFNGPESKPEATGPSGGKNDDFTNKSVTIDTAQAGWTGGVPNAVDPQSTGFTNSVSQDPATATRPQFVALLPTAPASATDLPNGTIVKIVANGVTVSYTYTQGSGFAPTTPGTLPISILVPVTGSANYGVEVDLPLTTQMTGFPVSITSFANGAPAVIDPNGIIAPIPAITGNNILDVTDAQNITIDRLYTGYLKMAKEAQVYKIEGGVTTIVAPFSSTAPKAEPGQYIEYRIKYSNISEPVPSGSNSVGMAANNIKIKENGTAGGNNWGTFTDHKPNTAQDSNGVIKYDNGAKTNGDTVIGEYLDTVPTLAPGAFGTFTFTRQVK